ncbi:hypothetical protein SCAR479_02771 [Seiridium cardinale]|uniref:Uncharacterized protein n=1 Tax=Seiridium cardinale TaxID=138064 RepID=A0ABR2Y2B5_9PEZI
MAPTNTNSSEGQKVDLGRNAPVTHEGVGSVDSGSLAAESAAFKSSNDISSSDFSSENTSTPKPYEGSLGSSASTAQKAQSAHGTGRSSNQVDQAPSYVTSQLASTDSSGPHGKNITEDPNLSGKNASFTEFGTKADPGRLAEQKFVAAGSTSGTAGGVGREKGIDGKTPYDALGSETSA